MRTATRARTRGLFTILPLALVAALMHLVHTPSPARAEEDAPCFLAANGTLTCPDDTAPAPSYSPPDLLNPRVVAEAPGHADALRRFEAKAIELTLARHGLPASDRDAALTWARNDAQATLWSLVVDAMTTPQAEQTIDQRHVATWMADLLDAQNLSAAHHAAAEYARYAGLEVGLFWNKMRWRSELELRDFLAAPAVAYNKATKVESTGGFCKYRSPAPYQEEYTGHTVQSCYTPCTGMFCPTPTPKFDQFVRWGQGLATSYLSSPSFATLAMQAAVTGTAGAGLVAAAGTAAFIGSTLGASAVGQWLAFALPGFAVTEAIAGGTMSTLLVGGAAAAVLSIALVVVGVLTIVAALAALIINATSLLDQDSLPSKLAKLVAQARSRHADVSAMMRTGEGRSALFSLFVTSTTPVRTDETCDNSIIPLEYYGDTQFYDVPYLNPATGRLSPVRVVPCLNPPAVPAATDADPHFVVEEPLKGTTTRSPTLTVPVPDSDVATTKVRMSGNWFVRQAGEGTTSTQTQSLWFAFTDWDGRQTYASVVRGPQGEYVFAGIYEKALQVGVDPETCKQDGTCWSRHGLHYVDRDGNRYVAYIEN